MKPSVGRIVHMVLPIGNGKGETRAAMIVRVWNDICVNLHVFLDGSNDAGASERWTSVVQTDETAREPGKWFWPPRV